MRIAHVRREFLRAAAGSSLVVGVDSRVPSCFLQAAESVSSAVDRVLVVVQLSGGNDGLNTVVPFRDDEYYKARPTLAIGKATAIRLDDQIGLHPSLGDLADLRDDGQFAVVHAVGYENPNRSHFESMDIWHTCKRKGEQRAIGWLGQLLDGERADMGGDVPALHFGAQQQPLALAGAQVRVPSVKSIEEFRLKSRDTSDFETLIQELARGEEVPANDLLSFVQSSTSSAIVASKRVSAARKSYEPAATYPDSPLAEKLSVVAQLIDAELATRIYYVELDGFDTHAQQADAHAALLKQWGEAVGAFVRDLNSHGHADRVCVMTFSEFGRRVAENASGGTDHGAAAPVFFAGGGLRSAEVGNLPSLSDLQDGDLKFAIDFRQVYASVLRDWLGAKAEAIVGGAYETLPLFRS